MSKTLTCRELGGICDEKFSGETFMEIVQKGMSHVMFDGAHMDAVMNLEKNTGENREQWMARMQGEFDAKPLDQ